WLVRFPPPAGRGEVVGSIPPSRREGGQGGGADEVEDEKKKIHDLVTKTLDEHELVWRLREVGLWPEGEPVPEEPAAAQEERAAIEAELAQLRKQSAKVADPEKALAQERVRRWHESKKRRAIAKAEREAEAKARREAWSAERA